MAYAELTPPKLAAAAGLSIKATARVHDPGSWNPRLSTLARLDAVIPPDFDPAKAAAEYADSLARIRAWIKATDQKRYQIVDQHGFAYEWVREIWTDDWAPTWFVVRRLLALVPAEFDHEKPNGKR